MTRLLVSVRNAEEAVAAVQGGADIIDVKEPHHGSLGCAAPQTILQIGSALGSLNPQLPLSLALGELGEWHLRHDQQPHRVQQPHLDNRSFRVPREELSDAIQCVTPQFLKLGLADCGAKNSTTWCEDWQLVRNSIPGKHAWVAVAYADHNAAHSPPVQAVLDAAKETNCDILLIDTHTKNGTTLLDHLTVDQLLDIRQTASRHGLKLALAGRVALSNLSMLLGIQADIIAVRGAVCENGNRTSSVSRELVREFRDAVHRS